MITLDQMSGLANALIEADEFVEQKEQELKDAKENARILREETIPSSMQELGIEKMTLDNGNTIKIAQEVYASIPAANKPAAMEWLNANGFGGLIKTDVELKFSRGEQDEAVELFNKLHEQYGEAASISEGVHAQTLKAFLKEQLAAGKDIPLDLFGARPVWCAKISSK